MGLAARKPPAHRTHLVEQSLDVGHVWRLEIPPRQRQLKRCSCLLRRAAFCCEPGPSRTRVIAIGLRKVEHDAIHRPTKLIKERPVLPPNLRKQNPKLTNCLKRTLLNNELHKCDVLFRWVWVSKKAQADPNPSEKDITR